MSRTLAYWCDNHSFDTYILYYSREELSFFETRVARLNQSRRQFGLKRYLFPRVKAKAAFQAIEWQVLCCSCRSSTLSSSRFCSTILSSSPVSGFRFEPPLATPQLLAYSRRISDKFSVKRTFLTNLNFETSKVRTFAVQPTWVLDN